MKGIDAIAYAKASNDFGLTKDRFLDYLQKQYQLDELQSLILAAEILHVFPRNVENNKKIKSVIAAAAIRIRLSATQGKNN